MAKATPKKMTASSASAPAQYTRPTAQKVDFDPADVVVTKKLTSEFRWQEEVPAHLKFLSPIVVSTRVDKRKDSDKPKNEAGGVRQPPNVAECFVFETGDTAEVICAALVKSTLEERYPDEAYIGKCFRIVQHAKQAGKNYRKYQIDEIQAPYPTN